MKKLFAVLLFLLPIVALGQTIDARGLTKEQQAELTAQAAKMKSPEGISAAARKEVGAWADLGG